MIKIGTIGTSSITEQFVEAAIKNPNCKVTCCYSRDKSRAQNLIRNNKLYAKAVDNFEQMLDEVDAIYIASPNGLHYEQAKYFLTQQKHVLLEKPLTLSFNEALELFEIAKRNNVFLMEAYKTFHTPQFGHLFQFVKDYQPFIANLNLNKYSSRMEKIKMGHYDSVFDFNLGKGSTYDLLIYPVELSIALFGPVVEVKSMGQKILNGSGMNDCVILRHESDVLTNIVCSKASNGRVQSELLSDLATLTFKNVIQLEEISFYNTNSNEQQLLHKTNADKDLFEFELTVFLKMIYENDFNLRDYLLDISCETVRVLNIVEKNQEKSGDN
ncbi:Gfo/Idh/MocA family protein [Spiroplasma monobiae]|uniref:Scyllo-inositol 2-dehydrogenase (NADP+) n=1 Tax=Spiroplasma monobiae MQ-1 TaxID=1336748 RepID=A0A2K9LW71_SPISQ|nr:Gfo/Idh/MocA family oxidoreductase [Spiroplasma monobiae]AUM62635.1 scyllo-inositol 2-dehydrogenase (NADP+) [Spiroplasma monobiae MQ-1]